MIYEARTKDQPQLTYGVWNNDMLAFQYINDWNGTETLSLEEAENVAKKLEGKRNER